MRRRACTPGFSSALSTYSSPPSGLASQIRSYRSNTRAALTAKYGSRGKIRDRCCHGLSTFCASQRRTVDAEIDAVMPGPRSRGPVPGSSTSPAASRSLRAARTPAPSPARPPVGERARLAGTLAVGQPGSPPSANRLRQRLTTSACTSSRRAIAVFANPSAVISYFTAPRSRSSAPGRTRRRSRIAAGVQGSRDPPSRLADEPSPAAWPPMVICRVAIRHSYGPLGVSPGEPHRRPVLRSGRTCSDDYLCRPARLTDRCARPPAFARRGPGPGPRIFAQPRGGHRPAGDAPRIGRWLGCRWCYRTGGRRRQRVARGHPCGRPGRRRGVGAVRCGSGQPPGPDSPPGSRCAGRHAANSPGIGRELARARAPGPVRPRARRWWTASAASSA